MLSTATYFSCNFTYTINYKWSSNLIVNSTLMIKTDLTSNPTWQSTSLVVQPNSLAYGLYAFNLQVNVTISKPTNTLLTKSITTHVQVNPTGLAVNGLQNGVSGLLVGTQQSFSLNPASFSLDIDYVIKQSSLLFKFYCFTINPNSNPLINTSQSIDLLTYKSNSLLQMNSNSTCFSSNCNFRFYLFFLL